MAPDTQIRFERKYQFQLLAPLSFDGLSDRFPQCGADPFEHARLLSAAQKLRGAIYLSDGAIKASDLDSEGRFYMDGDAKSWHLLLLDGAGAVVGCLRYIPHTFGVRFEDLHVRHAAIFDQPPAASVRAAIERDLDLARVNRLAYVEIGAWAIDEKWRMTKAALDMVASSYALGELWGGSLGICTATARHGSASILRKFGASQFAVEGEFLQPYEDQRFQCSMELLRFDRRPAQRFAALVDPMKRELRNTNVLLPAVADKRQWETRKEVA